MSLSIPVIRSVSLITLGASIILASATVDAQIGGLIKKKAGAAAGKVVNKSQGTEANAAEDLSKLGSPFTAASLDRVLSALEINAKAWAASDSIARQIEPLELQMGEFNSSKSSQEINAYGTKHGEWVMCRDAASRAHTEANADQSQAMADKMAAMTRADPAAAQKLAADFAKMGQEMTAALTRGDTVGALAIQEEVYKKYGLESALGISEDELRNKCGKEPVAPAALAVRDNLQARIDALRTRKRDAESAAQEKARAASGMSAEEFHPMNERVERWYAIAVKRAKGQRFWSDAEGALLDSRRTRIERVFEMRKG
jgi:hypothetical protein